MRLPIPTFPIDFPEPSGYDAAVGKTALPGGRKADGQRERRRRQDGLCSVGDAAGQVKPTTGGGVYYGLICANIAADTANQALNIGDLSKKNLSGYETGWRGVLGKELQIGYLARRMYENLSDQQIERIFDLVKEYNLHNELLNSPDFSFDWHSGPLLKTLRHKIIGKNIR